MNFGIFGGGHCNVTSSDVGALCMHPTLQGQQLLVDDVPRTKGAAPTQKVHLWGARRSYNTGCQQGDQFMFPKCGKSAVL